MSTHAFSEDPRVGRPYGDPAHNEFKDEVVRGESAEEHRAEAMPGSHQDVYRGAGIKGANCVTETGVTIAPNKKGYKKCVDRANRPK